MESLLLNLLLGFIVLAIVFGIAAFTLPDYKIKK